MTISKPFEDKRQYPRFESTNIVRMIGPGGERLAGKASLVNISEGGALFYSAAPLEAHAEVRLHIEIPEFHSSLDVPARVAWVQRSTEHEDGWFVGAEFTVIRENERGLISRLRKESGSGPS